MNCKFYEIDKLKSIEEIENKIKCLVELDCDFMQNDVKTEIIGELLKKISYLKDSETENKMECKKCGSNVIVAGRITHWYECEKCGAINPGDVSKKE